MKTPLLKTLFSGKGLIDSVRQIVDEIVTTKEEKAHIESRLMELAQQHEQSLLTAEIEDRKSARAREVDALKSGSKNITQNLLAYLGIIAFFSITAYITAHGIDVMNAEESFIIGNLTGMAAAIAKDIYSYYFGSSKGESEAKAKIGRFK